MVTVKELTQMKKKYLVTTTGTIIVRTGIVILHHNHL